MPYKLRCLSTETIHFTVKINHHWEAKCFIFVEPGILVFWFLNFLRFLFSLGKNYLVYHSSKHVPYSLYPLRFIMNLSRKHLAFVIIVFHYLL